MTEIEQLDYLVRGPVCSALSETDRTIMINDLYVDLVEHDAERDESLRTAQMEAEDAEERATMAESYKDDYEKLYKAVSTWLAVRKEADTLQHLSAAEVLTHCEAAEADLKRVFEKCDAP